MFFFWYEHQKSEKIKLVTFGTFLSHLFVAGCDIRVRFSVRSFVRLSVRLSTIEVKSSIKVHFSVAVILRVLNLA